MIPKTIHYCWFGSSKFNDLSIKCIGSWGKHNPEYQLKLWNEDNSPMDNPFVFKMYKEKKWAFVSDYVRLYALFNEGGIYLDTDMEVLKPLDIFLDNNCFLGFEDRVNVNCAIAGSVANHDFIKSCLHEYDSLRRPVNIPAIITKVLTDRGLRFYGDQIIKDVTLYSTSKFYPWPFSTKFDETMIKDDSYTLHHWQKSWTLSLKDRLQKRLIQLF